ncbi:EpsG family protein [Pectobacterium punjabense]|uniref:EpsG family protein n=1 Tax=Pectobacterium punjabense TaxID=2108399 RepID=UPI002B24DE26|nr:EpsG family protein [Pectobacterium punjabense]
MFPYLVAFSLSFINATFRNRISILFLLFFIIAMSLFRANVGFDWDNYETIYQGNSDYFFVNEPAFYSLINICRAVGFTFPIFVSLCSLITLFFYYRGIKYFFPSINEFSLSLSYFVLTYCYFEHFNIIRQGIAISIFFYAWTFIEKRNFLLYTGAIFLAVSFHAASIMLFPMYYILRTRVLNKYIYISVILFLMIVVRFDINYFIVNLLGHLQGFEFIDRYLSSSTMQSDFITKKSDLGLSKLYPALVFLFCLSLSTPKIEKLRDVIFFNAGFISLIVLLLSYQVDLFFRFFSFFETSFILFFTIIFSGFSFNNRVFLHAFNMLVYSIITMNMILILELDKYSTYLKYLF